MQITLDNTHGAHLIDSCAPGNVTINRVIYYQSLIITPHEIITAWPPRDVQAISVDSLLPIIALKPEVVLLGTGKSMHFIDSQLLLLFQQRQIGIEVMSTSAACRTYNALAADQRRVVAGLIIHS